MRRRVASPVPAFDVVPEYVIEAARRAFIMRARTDGNFFLRVPHVPLTVDLREAYECRGS